MAQDTMQADKSAVQGRNIRKLLADFTMLRRERNAPHPAWILAAPAAQVKLLLVNAMNVCVSQLSVLACSVSRS